MGPLCLGVYVACVLEDSGSTQEALDTRGWIREKVTPFERLDAFVWRESRKRPTLIYTYTPTQLSEHSNTNVPVTPSRIDFSGSPRLEDNKCSH
jgi:hypothetical protein